MVIKFSSYLLRTVKSKLHKGSRNISEFHPKFVSKRGKTTLISTPTPQPYSSIPRAITTQSQHNRVKTLPKHVFITTKTTSTTKRPISGAKLEQKKGSNKKQYQ